MWAFTYPKKSYIHWLCNSALCCTRIAIEVVLTNFVNLISKGEDRWLSEGEWGKRIYVGSTYRSNTGSLRPAFLRTCTISLGPPPTYVLRCPLITSSHTPLGEATDIARFCSSAMSRSVLSSFGSDIWLTVSHNFSKPRGSGWWKGVDIVKMVGWQVYKT